MKGFITAIVLTLFFVLACNNDKAPATDVNNAANKKDSVAKSKTIVFFGNSLTAGYGLTPSDAFPSLIQIKIDSLGLPYKVVNAGVSGETSTGGNSRIDWILVFLSRDSAAASNQDAFMFRIKPKPLSVIVY